MPNLNVPDRPKLLALHDGEIRIAWVCPVTRNSSWNIYAGVVGVAPIPGPPVSVSPVRGLHTSFPIAAIAGYASNNKIYVAVTSIDDVTGQESAQSPLLEVAVNIGPPGSSEKTLLVGRTPRSLNTYISTDNEGRIVLGASTPSSGLATEAKQDNQITILNSIDAGIPAALGPTVAANSMPVTLATNQPPIPISDTVNTHIQNDIPVATIAVIVSTPVLANRKLIVLQNNSARDILVGDIVLQGHVIPRNGGIRSFSAGPLMVLYAKVTVGTAVLNVWQMA